MSVNLAKILTQLRPCYYNFDWQTIKSWLLPNELEILVRLGILKPSKNLSQILCESCDEGHFVEIKFDEENQPFYVCPQDSQRSYIKPEKLKTWNFSIGRFLLLFRQVLGIEGDQRIAEHIRGVLWGLGLGEIDGVKYNLFFTLKTNAIDKNKQSVITHLSKSVLFYIDSPHVDLSEEITLIPILDILTDVNQTGFQVDEDTLLSYFVPEPLVEKEGDIKLDKNILLSQRQLCFIRTNAGRYKKSEKITPQEHYIIQHVHQIKNYEQRTLSLQELASKFTTRRSKVSVSNRIKRINNLCDKYKVKSIFSKDSQDRWGLNPKLDCCG